MSKEAPQKQISKQKQKEKDKIPKIQEPRGQRERKQPPAKAGTPAPKQVPQPAEFTSTRFSVCQKFYGLSTRYNLPQWTVHLAENQMKKAKDNEIAKKRLEKKKEYILKRHQSQHPIVTGKRVADNLKTTLYPYARTTLLNKQGNMGGKRRGKGTRAPVQLVVRVKSAIPETTAITSDEEFDLKLDVLGDELTKSFTGLHDTANLNMFTESENESFSPTEREESDVTVMNTVANVSLSMPAPGDRTRQQEMKDKARTKKKDSKLDFEQYDEIIPDAELLEKNSPENPRKRIDEKEKKISTEKCDKTSTQNLPKPVEKTQKSALKPPPVEKTQRRSSDKVQKPPAEIKQKKSNENIQATVSCVTVPVIGSEDEI